MARERGTVGGSRVRARAQVFAAAAGRERAGPPSRRPRSARCWAATGSTRRWWRWIPERNPSPTTTSMGGRSGCSSWPERPPCGTRRVRMSSRPAISSASRRARPVPTGWQSRRLGRAGAPPLDDGPAGQCLLPRDRALAAPKRTRKTRSSSGPARRWASNEPLRHRRAGNDRAARKRGVCRGSRNRHDGSSHQCDPALDQALGRVHVRRAHPRGPARAARRQPRIGTVRGTGVPVPVVRGALRSPRACSSRSPPSAARRSAGTPLLGLAGPAAAMIVGVGLVRVLGGSGASFLAYLGTIATPALAAVARMDGALAAAPGRDRGRRACSTSSPGRPTDTCARSPRRS